jgi:chromate transport protein ChrA
MQRDLVEDRRWISKQDYLEGLALAQLAPGPLAAQLAMYLGWVRARVLGATLVSAAFVLPSFAMTVAIAAAYLRFGGLFWIQGAFYGIGAAVIAIIVRSAWKLMKLSLKRDWLLWAIFLVLGVVTAATESEIVWLFLGGGVLAMLVKAPPRLGPGPAAAAAVLPVWLFSGLTGPQPDVLWRILGFFTVAGAFVFGSGLAIVPFLHGGVVNDYHWLNERQFLDAVAVAMITPGPVVITVAFIGYLVAGPAGVHGRTGRVPPHLPVRRHPGALLPPLRAQRADRGLRGGGHGGGHGRHRRRGLRARSTGHRGSPDHCHGTGDAGGSDLGEESPRADRDPGSGPGRCVAERERGDMTDRSRTGQKRCRPCFWPPGAKSPTATSWSWSTWTESTTRLRRWRGLDFAHARSDMQPGRESAPWGF